MYFTEAKGFDSILLGCGDPASLPFYSLPQKLPWPSMERWLEMLVVDWADMFSDIFVLVKVRGNEYFRFTSLHPADTGSMHLKSIKYTSFSRLWITCTTSHQKTG